MPHTTTRDDKGYREVAAFNEPQQPVHYQITEFAKAFTAGMPFVMTNSIRYKTHDAAWLANQARELIDAKGWNLKVKPDGYFGLVTVEAV